MNKDIIKKHLSLLSSLNEAGVPGVTVTKAVQKKAGEQNKKANKDVEKEMASYEKTLKNKGKENIEPPKVNYATDDQKTYHDEMEIRNGQEMLKYGNEPNKKFKERAIAALEGDSKMGNKIYTGKENGNTESVWGASNDNFGKELVKTIKASAKKRDDSMGTITQFGNDIEFNSQGTKNTGHNKKVAVENKENTNNKIMNESEIKKGKFTTWCKSNGFKDGPSIACAKKALAGDSTSAHKMATFYMNTVQPKGKTTKDINENNTETISEQKNNTTMKRLTFKKPFNGLSKALQVIPESYKVDKKVFEMTDGNENYKIRWEGSLNEGRAIVLIANDKKLMNESLEKMKYLFSYKSQDTLGLVHGKERINEDIVFNDTLNKSRKLMNESSDEIEGVKPDSEATYKDKFGATYATSHIPAEAKKTLQTKDSDVKNPKVAPMDKTGTKFDSKNIPAEAGKSLQKDDMQDKVSVEGEANYKGTHGVKFDSKDIPAEAGKKLNEDEKEIENDEIENDEDNLEVDDNWGKTSDDDADSEKEPDATELKGDSLPVASNDEDEPTPATGNYQKVGLFQSKSSGNYIIVGTTADGKKDYTDVPEQYIDLAKKNPKIALSKIMSNMELADTMDESKKPSAKLTNKAVVVKK